MQHLFYIHSHTTFLTALGTISFLNLKNEDVVFVYSRNYKNTIIPITFAQVDFSDLFASSMKRGEEFFFWKLNKLVKQVDYKLSAMISDDYVAYLPHVGVFLPQVIATNSSCKGVRFIEEGIGCYSSTIGKYSYSLREITKVILSFLVNQYRRYWFTDEPFLHAILHRRLLLETETFGLSSATFIGLSLKKNIIKWPDFKANVNLNQNFPIYIFEAAIEQKFITESRYLESVDRMLQQSFKSKNYVKFHPAQSDENKERIKRMFLNKGCELIELPIDVPFELILLQYTDLTILGFGSSLLLYAKSLGHRVHSFESMLLDDPLYIRYKKIVDYNF